MQNVLLGGLITLAGTALVQILVIPQVQRRTRALERWEDNFTDLVTVVNEELLIGLNRLRDTYRIVIATRERDGLAAEDLQAEVTRALETARSAFNENFDLTVKAYRLLIRCSQVNSSAPYWSELTARLKEVSVELGSLDPDRLGYHTRNDDYDRDWNSLISGSRRRLALLLEQQLTPLRPPRRNGSPDYRRLYPSR